MRLKCSIFFFFFSFLRRGGCWYQAWWFSCLPGRERLATLKALWHQKTRYGRCWNHGALQTSETGQQRLEAAGYRSPWLRLPPGFMSQNQLGGWSWKSTCKDGWCPASKRPFERSFWRDLFESANLIMSFSNHIQYFNGFSLLLGRRPEPWRSPKKVLHNMNVACLSQESPPHFLCAQ